MLNYSDYLFEQKLDFFLSSINEEMEWTSDNEVVWDNIETFVKTSDNKVVWDSIDNQVNGLPSKIQTFIKKLLLKSKKFLDENDITKERVNKIINSLISKIFKLVKNSDLRKKLIQILILFFFVVTSTSFNIKDISTVNSDKVPVIEEVIKNVEQTSPKVVKIDDIKKVDIKKIESKGDLNNFLTKLAHKESSGNWKSVNRYGYIGLYQFGEDALKDTGNDKITSDDFKKNPNIFPPKEQHKAMIKLLNKNKHYLRNFLNYEGKIINGIKITRSGLLAAAHLIGNGSVKKFLKSDGETDKADRNGTKCSDYLQLFSHYELGI